MERITGIESPEILVEHQHRYELAAQVARGAVLDISCGIGYGAPIICASPKVRAYLGLDIDQDTIQSAQSRYANQLISFAVGDICDLARERESFDTVVCLETLEHLRHPERAVAELARVLSADGVLVISVPTRDFETRCVELFGPNEFHFQAFSREDLRALLSPYFPHLAFYCASLEIGTRFTSREEPNATNLPLPSEAAELGSYFVIAAKSAAALSSALLPAQYLPGLSFIEHQAAINTNYVALTQSIDERDALIKRTEALHREALAAFHATEKLVVERDIYIKQLEARVEVLQAELNNLQCPQEVTPQRARL